MDTYAHPRGQTPADILPAPAIGSQLSNLVEFAFATRAAVLAERPVAYEPPSHHPMLLTLNTVAQHLRRQGVFAAVYWIPRSRHAEYKSLTLLIDAPPVPARFTVEAQRKGTVTLTGMVGSCLLVSSMPTRDYAPFYLERALYSWLTEVARHVRP